MTRRSQLFAFFALACALSWFFEIPLALSKMGMISVSLPFFLHYLAGYGPMLAAVLLTWFTLGTEGVRELISRIFMWRVRPIWWLAALSPLGIYGITQIALLILQARRPDFSLLGHIKFMPPLGILALPFWVLTFGLGEEVGWRGFLLPRLQERRSALSASLILWTMWAFWHLPLFFYIYEPTVIPGMLLGLLAGAVLLTWLYNSTGGSLLMVILWHGTFNFITASEAGKGTIAAVESMFVILTAIFVFGASRSFRQSSELRQSLRTVEETIAEVFSMTDKVWERHANPLSVWTRYSVLPILVMAFWSRIWLGWWAVACVAAAIAWTWLNPRLFSQPASTDNWASKAVLGERVWLNRKRIRIPTHHKNLPHILSVLSAIGMVFCIYGVAALHVWVTLFGIALVYMAKSWFLDRMVWLYDEMKRPHAEEDT